MIGLITSFLKEKYPLTPPNSSIFKIEDGKLYFLCHSTERVYYEWVQVEWLVTDPSSGAYWRKIISAAAVEEWKREIERLRPTSKFIEIESPIENNFEHESIKIKIQPEIENIKSNICAWRVWGKEKQN